MRYIEQIHSLPGRTRLRASWLHDAPDQARALAETLAAVPGVTEVRARPYTGSLLVLHDPSVTAERLVEVARSAGGAEQVVGPGEPRPLPPRPPHSSVAREAARFFRQLDEDVLRGTDGKLDLGTMAALTFMAAGALGVAVSQKLPAPPWFNLAWWGFRTFMTLEGEEIADTK